MRLLTPTENRRLNELIGFLSISFGLLIALSLLSYNPHDPSFNVAGASSRPVNWIGPVGAHSSDLLFQGFGYAAFLLPAGIFALGARWFRSKTIDSAIASLIGYSLMVLGFPALLALWHLPEVRGAAPPGGLFGELVANGAEAALGSIGAQLVIISALLAALFLTTRFSIIAAHKFAKMPFAKLNIFERAKDYWFEWQEKREQARLQKRLEDVKISGRQPVTQQATVAKPMQKAVIANLDEEEQEPEAAEPAERSSKRAPVVLRFREQKEQPETPAPSAREIWPRSQNREISRRFQTSSDELAPQF